jgi:hypothetical protein
MLAEAHEAATVLTIDPIAAVVGIAALVTTNIFALVGVYVSVRVQITRLQVTVERLEKDFDEVRDFMRASSKN